MEFLDIIGTIIDFSQKQDEFSDEKKAINATLKSLMLTIKQVDRQELPCHLSEMLNDDLEEAKMLLSKATNSPKTWWTSFRNMLPGSELQKLREKNQQLIHMINLINLHLNSTSGTSSRKRSASSSYALEMETIGNNKVNKKIKRTTMTITDNKENDGIIPETFEELQPDFIQACTQEYGKESQDRPSSVSQETSQQRRLRLEGRKVAFKLQLLYDTHLARNLKYEKDNFEPVITSYWEDANQVRYNIQRIGFGYLPDVELQKISREHAVIKAIKNKDPLDDKKMTALMALTQSQDNNKQMDEELTHEDKPMYIFQDLGSSNGTYLLKGVKKDISMNQFRGLNMSGNFHRVRKNQAVALEHGDIIALIVQKPDCQKLVFGFRFLTH